MAVNEVSDDLFNYCVKNCDKHIYRSYGWWKNFITVALNMANNNKRYDLLLRKLDEIIQKEQNEAKKNNYQSFALQEFMLKKYELLNKKGLEDEALQFLFKNAHYSMLRQLALEITFANKNYCEAIRLAQEGIFGEVI